MSRGFPLLRNQVGRSILSGRFNQESELCPESDLQAELLRGIEAESFLAWQLTTHRLAEFPTGYQG